MRHEGTADCQLSQAAESCVQCSESSLFRGRFMNSTYQTRYLWQLYSYHAGQMSLSVPDVRYFPHIIFHAGFSITLTFWSNKFFISYDTLVY